MDIITRISHFTLKIIPSFNIFKSFFNLKRGYSLIDFDVIFRIHSSEFIKLLNFGSNLKKKIEKTNQIFLIFHLKIDFYK